MSDALAELNNMYGLGVQAALADPEASKSLRRKTGAAWDQYYHGAVEGSRLRESFEAEMKATDVDEEA
jgi:hypothetical protein